MKTVGIIGGLGPETTAHFYIKVVMSCLKKNKTQKPSILIYNVPITNTIEENFILKGRLDKKIIPLLVNAARHLEKGGADFIVIPCNTVHLFIDEVKKSVHIPVLSIIDETINFLKMKQVKKIGLLATPSTIKYNLYTTKLDENQIITHVPTHNEIEKMGNIINNLINSVFYKNDKAIFMDIVNSIHEKGVSCFVLACTDLQSLNPKKKEIQFFDTMEILATATVNEMLKD